jgi:hypothetical protein
MAVYKIFPEKDATLYSDYPVMNTGLDEILEIGNNISIENTVRRSVIKFSTAEINDVVNNLFNVSSRVSQSFSASLKLYFATGNNVPLNYDVECYPISSSWDMGTGKFEDSPENTSGVSWIYRTSNPLQTWSAGTLATNVTNSYYSIPGGGTWYYTSSQFSNIKTTQSFTYYSDNDINIDVTDSIKAIYTGSIVNEGFILKLDDNVEFTDTEISLKYFSRDTNTIYPPQLEIKWNDFVFNTGSSGQTILTDPNIVITLPNNLGEYYLESVQRFRVNVRPQFPPRIFSTSSFYTTNYYLPTASYWSIKDLDTNEVVIDFDSTYTKISADFTSNYFDVYMSGLEPERYYQILIKTTIGGSTQVLDDKYYFKVING